MREQGKTWDWGGKEIDMHAFPPHSFTPALCLQEP